MKLSFKTILPILLIFTLLILFAGCFITPSDEQPGYTPGTITGIIAAPCCSTSADPVPDPCCIAPEYWCYYCENTWSLQDNIKVVLTYGEDEIATVFTNEDGEYTFTNVAPGKNYVITALCPDYDDDRPLVKDVALELIEGGSFDTKITDCVSTALGLVVDYLVENTELTPEEIVLDGVIAGIPNFYGFPEFKKLVLRICEISTGCVNLFEDEKVMDYLCRAAQEIGRKVLPKLDLGCVAGYAPSGPTPTPGACDGNVAPVINFITPTTATVGVPYSGQVNVTDDGTITKYELISGPGWLNINSSTGALSGAPTGDDVCSCSNGAARVVAAKLCEGITVKVTDNCGAFVQGSFCIEVISPQYTLAVTIVGSGTVTLDPTGGTYLSGTSVKLTAVPATGWAFTGWSVDLVSTNNPENIIMNSNKNVTATFVKTPEIYLSYSGDVKCHDWIYVNIKDAINLNKAEITLRYNRNRVYIENIKGGTLMDPYSLSWNDQWDGSPYKKVTVEVTRNGGIEVTGDGTIMGIYFGQCGTDGSTVSIVNSKLYDKNGIEINHTLGTSSLSLPGPGGWE